MMNRCGKCKNCELVKASQRLLCPNPPFTHADNLTVETWNRVLIDNPCLNQVPDDIEAAFNAGWCAAMEYGPDGGEQAWKDYQRRIEKCAATGAKSSG
jgi:hypothetical protein